VARGETTTLHVTAATNDVAFAWFAGARGDTSHRVGSNAPTFTTPAVTEPLHYWVRLTTACGSIDSDAMDVALNGRRRAVH
jgi:hypothetical protein